MKIWNIPSFGTWCSQNKPAVKWFIHFRQNCKTLEHTIFKNLWDPNLCSVREGFKNSPQQISNIITSFSWTSGINGKIHKFTDEEFFNPSLTYLVLALWRASPVSTLSCCFWRVSPSLAGAGRPEIRLSRDKPHYVEGSVGSRWLREGVQTEKVWNEIFSTLLEGGGWHNGFH